MDFLGAFFEMQTMEKVMHRRCRLQNYFKSNVLSYFYVLVDVDVDAVIVLVVVVIVVYVVADDDFLAIVIIDVCHVF